MRLTRRSVNLGVAASLAAPVFSRVARAADDTLKVGMVLPVTGPAADRRRICADRRQDRARSRQQIWRRVGKTGRTRHRGRPDDQSGCGARLLQARGAAGHCRLPRSGPFDAESRDRGRRPQDRQTGLLWRHRSRPDKDGQSLVHPLPAERHLFRARDRLLRRGDAGKEELGDRPFHRRFRHERLQTGVRRNRQTRRQGRHSIKAIRTRAKISRRSCSRSNPRAPTSSAPISPSKTIRRFSLGSCDSSA